MKESCCGLWSSSSLIFFFLFRKSIHRILFLPTVWWVRICCSSSLSKSSSWWFSGTKSSSSGTTTLTILSSKQLMTVASIMIWSMRSPTTKVMAFPSLSRHGSSRRHCPMNSMGQASRFHSSFLREGSGVSSSTTTTFLSLYKSSSSAAGRRPRWNTNTAFTAAASLAFLTTSMGSSIPDPSQGCGGRWRRNIPTTTSLYAQCEGLEGNEEMTANSQGGVVMDPMSPSPEEGEEENVVLVQPFASENGVLEYDHYNGVTLHLNQLSSEIKDRYQQNLSQFRQDLSTALRIWTTEGKKGVWIYCPQDQAEYIPHCTFHGFQFHFIKQVVKTEDDSSSSSSTPASTTSTMTSPMLILSRWLPSGTPSRLPLGPTHQVGVGIVVFHPEDPSRMLCVQEKTGPAAAYQLWKMPTGLLDPNEDIPEAARRELQEETGLDGKWEGILCFRQAHSPNRSSDLFFVCQMSLTSSPSSSTDPEQKYSSWKIQEEELADIQWMKVDDYCSQKTWQESPVYQKLNDSIQRVSTKLMRQRQQQQIEQQEEDDDYNRPKLILHEQLPLGFGGTKATNALFLSHL